LTDDVTLFLYEPTKKPNKQRAEDFVVFGPFELLYVPHHQKKKERNESLLCACMKEEGSEWWEEEEEEIKRIKSSS
jgi:hypothetical protein